jgi:outer membrane protein W
MAVLRSGLDRNGADRTGPGQNHELRREDVKKLLALMLVLVLVGTMSSAPAATKEGDQELSIALSYQKTGDANTIIASLGIGYFFTEAIEVRATLVAVRYDDGDTDATIIYVGADGLYHFNTAGETVPYVGAGANFVHIDSGGVSDGAAAVKGIAGLRHFLGEDTTINLEFNVIKILDEDVSDEITFQVLVGLSYYF